MQQLTKHSAPTKPISVLAISMAIILAMGVFVASFSWAEKLQVASEFLVPLEMKYSTKIKGMDVELTQRLVKNESGQFEESIVAKGVLGKVTEKGLFHLSQNGHVIPDSFTKQQKTIIGKRFEFQEYENGSWARVVMNVKGKQAHTPVISNSTIISKSKIIRAGRKKLNAKMLNYYDEEEWYDYIRQLSQISHLLETYNVNYRLLSFIIPKLTEERLYFLNNNFKWIADNIQESNIHEMYTYDPDTAKENQYHPTLENDESE